jgi:hypothetical protein
MTARVPARRRAALVAAALTAGVLATAAPTAAGAATNAYNLGDILTLSQGGTLFTPPSLDRVNPSTGARNQVTTFGLGRSLETLTTSPNGDSYVALGTGELFRVDHVTGAQELISSNVGGNLSDMVFDPRDASILAIRITSSHTNLVQIRLNGQVTVLSPVELDGFSQLAVAANGDAFITSGIELLHYHADGGQLLPFTTFDARASGIAIGPTGHLYVHVARNGNVHFAEIVRINPATAAVSVLAEGLPLHSPNTGLAFDAAGRLIAAEVDIDRDEKVIDRIDPATGSQHEIVRVASSESFDVGVAGMAQIGGSTQPVAADDAFAIALDHNSLTGNVLGNDRDPLGVPLHVASPTVPAHGVLSASGDGSFVYQANGGFAGVDTWTYRAVSQDGRTSSTATVRITVPGPQTPIARNDSFFTRFNTQLHITVPGVLANDTDPQGDKLSARLVTPPTQGTIIQGSDGSLIYDPPTNFSGTTRYTYEVSDPSGHRSDPATVTITVLADSAPSIAVSNGPGLSAGADGKSGTFPLSVLDQETPSASLKLSATSSNTAVVANSGIVFSTTNTGQPLVTITGTGTAGKALVTVKVSDGIKSRTTVLTVLTGTANADTLTGTSGADLLIGLGSGDTLSGGTGRDVLTGGAGEDTLTGGTFGDFFRGGSGTNTATDFSAAQGDAKIEI